MSGTFNTAISKLEKRYLDHNLKFNSIYLDYLQSKNPSVLEVMFIQGHTRINDIDLSQTRIDTFKELIECLHRENERNLKD